MAFIASAKGVLIKVNDIDDTTNVNEDSGGAGRRPVPATRQAPSSSPPLLLCSSPHQRHTSHHPHPSQMATSIRGIGGLWAPGMANPSLQPPPSRISKRNMPPHPVASCPCSHTPTRTPTRSNVIPSDDRSIAQCEDWSSASVSRDAGGRGPPASYPCRGAGVPDVDAGQ